MTAAEAMYFDGAPVAHIVAYRDRQRMALIRRRGVEAFARSQGRR